MNFEKRLEQACNNNPDIPKFGSGRQTVIAREMKVSTEAVRKWFNGLAMPRPQMMKALAKFLEVDHVWLSLGTDFRQTNELKDIAKHKDVCLYAFCGYALDKGFSIGFDSDDQAGAYLVVLVKDSTVRFVKLINADLLNNDLQKINNEQQRKNVTVVMAVRTRDSDFSFAFYELPDVMKNFNEHTVERSEGKTLVNGVNLETFK